MIKRTFLLMMCFALVTLTACCTLYAGEREFNEYEVKAAFLVNFFKFVEWPSRPGNDAGEYTLCIYGADPFGRYLEIMDGAKVRGRELEVKKVISRQYIRGCNVLFISSSERRRISTVMDTVRDMDILTVGDTDGYARSGIMLNFFIESKNIRFEINLNAIKRAKINVSSQLLKLGRIVDSE